MKMKDPCIIWGHLQVVEYLCVLTYEQTNGFGTQAICIGRHCPICRRPALENWHSIDPCPVSPVFMVAVEVLAPLKSTRVIELGNVCAVVRW